LCYSQYARRESKRTDNDGVNIDKRSILPKSALSENITHI